jgi:hypothetical protein
MSAHDGQTVSLLRAIVARRAEVCARMIAEQAVNITCWERVVVCAQLHGILPMLYSGLADCEDLIPPDALDLVRREFERNAFLCLANVAELLEVLNAFQANGISAMPFKGVVLGASAYGDVTRRSAGDLDLLIFHRDLLRATEILKERGYALTTNVLEDGRPEADDSFEYHFERGADGMVLELRWRLELTQPRFRQVLGMDWVWPQRRTVKLAGVDVPSLDSVSALLVLCMHGSRHSWSRLMWICDVAQLLESEPELDWDFAKREAERVGLWRCLALGVLLAHRVAGACVPADVLGVFEADSAAQRLAVFFEQYTLEDPGRVPEGRVPYHIQLLGFRDRASLALSLDFLRPNARDRAAIRLPKHLNALYYIVRPLRLLLDRSSR